MRDNLLLERLRVVCIIGDLPHERMYPQELFLDLELSCDLARVGQTDDLKDTIDYVAVADIVRAALERSRCRMIERAAQVAIDAVFSADARISACRVTLRKPHAVPGVVAGVSLFRERSDGGTSLPGRDEGTSAACTVMK